MLRRVAAILAVGFVTVMGCKTPHAQKSDVSSEGDIQPGQVMWVGTEGKWAVTCREGRLHNGQRSALVRTNELKTVCEEDDPNAGGGGGGGNPGGGGGGNNGGGDWDISMKCPNRPERVKNLNIALSPVWIAELQVLAPALATQQLCGGFVVRMNQLVTNSASLYDALIGTSTGSPMLILVGKATDPVQYDGGSFTLSIPWKIEDGTIDQIADQMDADSGINICGAEGRRVLGACWYRGKSGNGAENCIQACTRYGKIYDSRTATVAGVPNGTKDNCATVATEFGQAMHTNDQYADSPYCSNKASGCISASGTAYRCVSSPTTAEAVATQTYNGSNFVNEASRYCACK